MNDKPTPATEGQEQAATGEPGPMTAQNITFDGGSVESVTAETVTVNGGNIAQANAVTINLTDGGIAEAQGSTINVTDGGIAMARGDTISVNGGGVAAAMARRVEVNNGSIAFVAAGEVGGDAKVVFDLLARRSSSRRVRSGARYPQAANAPWLLQRRCPGRLTSQVWSCDMLLFAMMHAWLAPVLRPFRSVLAWMLELQKPVPERGETEIAAEVQRNYRWNFSVNLLDGAFFWFGASFMSSATILPLFVSKLTPSPLAIGLLAVFAQASWFLPQLFTANLVERLARKKPVVVNLGLFMERLPVWGLVLAAMIAVSNPTLSLVIFFVCFAWHGLGAGSLGTAWQDMIARMFPVERRGRFVGVTNFIGAGAWRDRRGRHHVAAEEPRVSDQLRRPVHNRGHRDHDQLGLAGARARAGAEIDRAAAQHERIPGRSARSVAPRPQLPPLSDRPAADGAGRYGYRLRHSLGAQTMERR